MNAMRPDRPTIALIARHAMIQFGLEPDFSPQALAEASALARPVIESGPEIADLRALLWCSIDNDDSRDLDQLTVAEQQPDGAVKILVAVADVDATVKKGSAIDAHARTNTTSVYTATQIFPMLPEKLSTDLTSLNENEERMAIVVEMTIAPDGSVGAGSIRRARVLNHAKLAYNGVAAWLDGDAEPPRALAAVNGLDEQLRIQDRVAQAMKRARHERGALTLDTLEARAVYDGDVLADLRPDERNRAKELIENFMIAANSTVVEFLAAKGMPCLRRVLRSPERWQRIVDLARASGDRLPSAPDASALEQFLARRRSADPARFPDLSLSVVKLLGSGEYVAQIARPREDDHFGLAVKSYTHSTAPNRRFPDLITQRMVKAALAGARSPYRDEELVELAAHCTEQEDDAAKIERQVAKSAAALLLSSRIGEEFDAIVTGASEKGTWVRIQHPTVEGKLVRGFEELDVGDRTRVKLVDTNVERGFIDFVRVPVAHAGSALRR